MSACCCLFVNRIGCKDLGQVSPNQIIVLVDFSLVFFFFTDL